MNLRLWPDEVAIAQAPPDFAAPVEFLSLTRTLTELSAIAALDAVAHFPKVEPGWRVLELEGPFAFTETGVLLRVLSPLAEAGVGILALSTYDTDLVLVKESLLELAVSSLESVGFSVFLG